MNFYGIDIEKATDVKDTIKQKYDFIVDQLENGIAEIRGALPNAFIGDQTSAMEEYVIAIREAIDSLFDYLAGDNSNFASTLEKAIFSYEQSDANVASGIRG